MGHISSFHPSFFHLLHHSLKLPQILPKSRHAFPLLELQVQPVALALMTVSRMNATAIATVIGMSVTVAVRLVEAMLMGTKAEPSSAVATAATATVRATVVRLYVTAVASYQPYLSG